jgi:hypothetical protein
MVVEAGQAILEEAFSPPADDFATAVQASRNSIIGQACGRKKNHSGAQDLKIR